MEPEPAARMVHPRAEELLALLQRAPTSDQMRQRGVVPDASYSTALAMFKEWSIFPPHSRPIDDSHEDVAQPFMTAAPEYPLDETAPDTKDSGAVVCALQPLRHTVSPGETLRVTLACRRPDPGGDPAESVSLPVRAEETTVERADAQQPSRIAPPSGNLAFVDDGSGGDAVARDNVFTLTMPVREDMAGILRISTQVALAVPGPKDPMGRRNLLASVTVAMRAPAHFTRRMAERVKDGSLVIDAEVQVQAGGRYRFMANLENNGSLIGYAKHDAELTPGTHIVPLLFFGKILTDAKVDGPLTITNLRGQRVDLGAGGQQGDEPLAPLELAHTTRAYSARDFSRAEWDSDYKRDRIAELETLARNETPTDVQAAAP